MGPLVRGFCFSIVNTVLHNLWLVESTDAEPWIGRAVCRSVVSFVSVDSGIPADPRTSYPQIPSGNCIKVKFTRTVSSELSKSEIKKTIPFITASKRIQYLQINLRKEV